MTHRTHEERPIWLATRTAPLLFWASLLFLVCQAVAVVIFVDVPNLRESFRGEAGIETPAGETLDDATPIDKSADTVETVPNVASPSLSRDEQIAAEAALAKPPVRESWQAIEMITMALMLLIWPLILAESVYHWSVRPWNRQTLRFHGYTLLYCLCPSLRMCAQNLEMGQRLWLPGWGWRRSDDRLRRRLERTFSVPMIWIALMILPVLVIELWLKNQVADYRWLRIALHVSTGVIWFSFAAEFILMASVAEKKLDYLKHHWIELAIILLPLLSFMRSLRLLRVTGASQLIRVSQLNQIVRTYRLRGTAMRALRALILLDLFQRLTLRNPEKTIAKLHLQLEELEKESKQIRRKIYRLQKTMQRAEAEADAKTSEANASEVEASDLGESIIPQESEPGSRPRRPAVESQSIRL